MSFNTAANTAGSPLDWTGGLGVFPAGGVINIPANSARVWFFVQNRDVGTVDVGYTAGIANGALGATYTSVFTLAGATVAGGQGGSDERCFATYIPTGTITITGTAGQQISILEG